MNGQGRVVVNIGALSLALAAWFWVGGCRSETERAVIYTSQDRIYAERILYRIEQETGIAVLPLYDSESVKTTGLKNRLVAERTNPRCDVFWSNEEMMVRKLAQEGLVDGEGALTFGYRSRRLVINTNFVGESSALELKNLTQPRWRGRVAVAYPLFGTTATHFMALRAAWGPQEWESWCRELIANEVKIVDGNSTVVRLVGQGEAWIGLTDYDDIAVGLRNGLPIRALPPSGEMSLIANTVAAVRGGPNPQNARLVQDFFRRPEVQAELFDLGALEGIDPGAVPHLPTDWDRIMADFDEAYRELSEWFLR